MELPTVVAPARLTDAEADELCGARLTHTSYDTLFRQSVRVVREDGTPLAVYLKGALSDELVASAYPVFRLMDSAPTNRGISTIGRRPSARVKADGTVSRTSSISKAEMEAAGMAGASSGVMGYMDRYPRMPYCRKTAFNMDNPEAFLAAMPYIQRVSQLFGEYLPERHAAQGAMCAKTSPDFVIPGTVFTTITVNKNYPTRVHKDAGDLKEGFGVLSVFRAGHYTGSHFVLPKYRVGFDLANGDLLLADVHEWHGNTEMVGDRSRCERVSCVFYYRERMHVCGTAAEELERAKRMGPKVNDE